MRVHELHAPVKVVQRSQGRSAVAAAAYRAGVEIEDERTGAVHDYTRKQGVENEALLLPANAPDWAHDRAKLWNAAELHEKHPRAQTARDLTVSFPSEFGPEQRREAGLKIGQWIVSRHGVAVDIAWHEPSREGDQRNHHAHFLFTTRRFEENGEWAKTKDRTLDDLKKGPEEITAMRLGVADTLNNIAARDKLNVYVEHLSYEKRGIEKEATQHMGPIATGMERDGMETEIGKKNRAIKERNEQRRKLFEEQKVIDIEIAREKLKARQQERDAQKAASPAPAVEERQQPEADPYETFYRDTQERRSALLENLERKHGEREKALRQEVAGIAGAMDNAGFFSRVWRGITGRTKADRERMAEATRQMEEIQRERQSAHEAFERDRQKNLEALKAAQMARQQEQEQLRAEEQAELPKAVGDVQARTMRQPQTRSQPQEAAPVSNYEARRREYFRRIGAAQKAEQQREDQRQETRKAQEIRQSPAPAFNEAQVQPNAEPERPIVEQPQPPAPAQPTPQEQSHISPALNAASAAVSNYEARKTAYMEKVQQERQQPKERDSGPTSKP